MTADLVLTASTRRVGKTTALLDIALANAARGQVVWFYSGNDPMAREAMRRAAELIRHDDVHVADYLKLPTISYPSGGAVLFLPSGAATVDARGRALPDLRINDWSGLTATIDRSAL